MILVPGDMIVDKKPYQYGALLSQIEDVAKEQVRAELQESELREDSDTIDARIKAKAREIRMAVFVSIQDWYRDLLVALDGPGRPLFFEEHRADIEAKAARVTERQAMDAIGFVGQLAEQINDRNLPVPAALAYWFGRLV